jgi:hypothetical protein
LGLGRVAVEGEMARSDDRGYGVRADEVGAGLGLGRVAVEGEMARSDDRGYGVAFQGWLGEKRAS